MCLTVLTYQVLTAEMPVRTRSQTANNNADTQEPVQVPLTREQKMMKKEEDRKRKYCQMKYDMEDRIAARALAKTTPSEEKKSKPKPKVALPKPQSNMYLGYHWASFPWDLPAVTAARKGK